MFLSAILYVKVIWKVKFRIMVLVIAVLEKNVK